MENQLLPMSQAKTGQDSASTDQLIREWLFRFGLNCEKDVVPLLPLWQEQLGGIEPATLVRLFERAMRMCKFFPKIAEILEPMQKAKEAATPEAAELEWEHVLELRRTRWSPDAPGGFYGGAPQLSERVQSACRAAGVFREFTSAEFEKGALHSWAKKRFVESFLAWEALEQGQYLLPDGEIKNLLAGVAETKALSTPEVCLEDLHKRGLQYAEECKVLSASKRAADALPGFDAETRAEIEVELSGYGKRFKTAMEKRRADRVAAILERQAVEA